MNIILETKLIAVKLLIIRIYNNIFVLFRLDSNEKKSK
jgi:hypothetical protein